MKSTGALARSNGRPCANPRDRFDEPSMGMCTRSAVYTRPDVYDMEYAGASNYDAHFFARLLARVRPRRVLEMACGSGRVTFTLAAALPLAEIVGVDSSIDMLGQAATARGAADPSVRGRVSLVEGDMRSWPGTGVPFDAVVDAKRRTPGEEARLLRCTATTYEPHLQRADVRQLYDRFDQGGLAERLVTDFASHIYFPAELELLFLSAGFEIAQQYGDYRFVPVDRTSPYVLTVARRPRGPGVAKGLCGSLRAAR